MTSRLRGIASAAARIVLALTAAGSAQATIHDCQPVAGSFTVFLSEPSYAPSTFQSDVEMRAFMQRLQFELDQGRDAGWVRSPSTDVRFVTCVGRAPALDGQEFVPSLVEGLYNGRVLLEIWGRLDAEPSAGAAPKLSAQMNYLLVPMRFAANENESAPAALQRLLYPEPNTPPAPDFVQLIARPLDIDAFVAAAFGFKLMREHANELAHRNLCRASGLLQKIESRPLAPRTRADIAALRKFVLESATHAIVSARADSTYSRTGVLWLQDPAQPCAGQA